MPFPSRGDIQRVVLDVFGLASSESQSRIRPVRRERKSLSGLLCGVENTSILFLAILTKQQAYFLMSVILRFGLIAGLVLSASSPCWAFQSGGRANAPSASFATPTFSAPQNYAPAPNASVLSSPSSIQSPSYQLGQPVVEGFEGQNQFGTPNVTNNGISNSTASALQTTASSSGNSSIGIPASSLVDPIFEISDPYSPYAVDHSTWDCLLARYMVTDAVGINRLRYRDVTAQDRSSLKGYLRYLQSVDTRTLNRNEQLAFWFNLYNARTADIVLDNYPIRSIRQVKMKFTDFVGPFDDPGAVTVLGKSLSLNDIESGIVRPIWKDPRIHYALNCASYGCPNLAAQAWTAVNLDARLNGAAYEYINSDRAIRSGLFGVKVSKIFKWYKDDFGGSDQAVLNHLRQYANPSTQQKLQGRQSILGHFYDWSLNDGKITHRRLLERVIR